MQMRLLFPAPPPEPEPARVIPTGRVILPAWYDDPCPDNEEMERRASVRDAALAAWQRKGAEFDDIDPPLPVRWSIWPEANAREKRKAAYTRTEHQALDNAREHYARGICLQARRDDNLRRAFAQIGG